MADHLELIAELPQVEKMATPDRLKHAKKRRMQQMKKWSQREKDYYRETNAKKKKTEQNMQKKSKKNDYKVHFVPSVMLLEAAARSDIDEDFSEINSKEEMLLSKGFFLHDTTITISDHVLHLFVPLIKYSVRRLLMLGVNPDSTNEDGLTALHQCCIDNNEEMMKLLIEFGANVNAEDSEKWTPLHAAATCGHLGLVKYLINKKANLLAVNADGNMPYDICENETLDYIELEMSKTGVTQELIDDTRDATEKLMLDDIKWLAQQNGNLEYRDAQEATPLHIAAANGYKFVVEFLLEQKVSVDVVDSDLWQPIHAAACWGHLEVLDLLVQNGASLDAKTKNGETPFDICEDIDMKDRMLELKNEMEIKRSTQRLKRSQSQNTRSHSVRRTSRREKIHMTRQEARDEAKIRMKVQEQTTDVEKSQSEMEKFNRENGESDFPSAVEVKNINKAIGDKPQMSVAPYPSQPEIEELRNVTNNEKTEKLIHGVNQDEAAATILKKRKETSDKNGTSISTSRSSDTVQCGSSSPASVHVPLTDVTVGLSIHLTVSARGQMATIASNGNGASTLAALKRQRMDQRKHNGSSQESPTTVTTHAETKMNGHKPEPNYGFGSGYGPPSPSVPVHKFTGMTAEEAMTSKKEHSCCIIL